MTEVKKPEPRTLKAILVGDRRLPMPDVELDDTHDIDAFATKAYKLGAGSLKRLLPQDWAVVIVVEQGTEHSFPLTKWHPLFSNEQVEEKRTAALAREAKRKAHT